MFIEYLATAPRNRRDDALSPLYLVCGEGLLHLARLHGYQWRLEGRVACFWLPRSRGFYKRHKFIERGHQEGRMIHYELTPDRAVDYLESKAILR